MVKYSPSGEPYSEPGASISLPSSNGSFAAVSTPIFAIKYLLESAWRVLQIPYSSCGMIFPFFRRAHSFERNSTERPKLLRRRIDNHKRTKQISPCTITVTLNHPFFNIGSKNDRTSHTLEKTTNNSICRTSWRNLVNFWIQSGAAAQNSWSSRKILKDE